MGEGLGISSFFLVAFSRSRRRSSGAFITIVTNRVGDIGYILSISYCLSNSMHLLGSLGILLASCTKRAQYPFSSWLPAAIAAPTPVSSLVHSRTLVTAGVYLIVPTALAKVCHYP